jgi:hypothetical protein
VVGPTQPCAPSQKLPPGSIQSKACLDRARHASTETKKAKRKHHEAHSQKVSVDGPLRDLRVATRRTRGRHIRCGADALGRVERVRARPKGYEGCIQRVIPSETHLARVRRATDAFCAAWRRVRCGANAVRCAGRMGAPRTRRRCHATYRTRSEHVRRVADVLRRTGRAPR